MIKKFKKNTPSLKTMIVSGALLYGATTLYSPAAIAEDSSQEHKKRGGKGFLKDLDLSEAQRAAIKELRQKNKAEMKALRESHKAAKAKLHQAQASSESSEGELKKLFDSAASKRRALEEARFNSMLDIRKILTPEQRVQMQSKMKSRFGKGRRGDKE